MVHGKVQVQFFFRNWSSKSSSKILRVHDFFSAIYFLVAVCLGHGRNAGRPEFRRLYHETVTLRPHTRSQLVWYDSMTLLYLKKYVGAHEILRHKRTSKVSCPGRFGEELLTANLFFDFANMSVSIVRSDSSKV